VCDRQITLNEESYRMCWSLHVIYKSHEYGFPATRWAATTQWEKLA